MGPQNFSVTEILLLSVTKNFSVTEYKYSVTFVTKDGTTVNVLRRGVMGPCKLTEIRSKLSGNSDYINRARRIFLLRMKLHKNKKSIYPITDQTCY